MIRRILLLWLLLLATVSSATAGPVGLPAAGVVYLPVVAFRPCPEANPKLAVALAYAEWGIPHEVLCQPRTGYYHTWGWVMGSDWWGERLPMVWADEKNGFDYAGKWAAYLAQWEVVNDRPYTGYLLFANEPDRPDQAAMAPEAVARLFLTLSEGCPGCRLVGPMYSASDAGWMVREVWEICAELGCDMSRLYAHSLHVYPRPLANFGPSARVDEFCRIVEGGDCTRPVWLTEMGYRTCFPAAYLVFKGWVREALVDERIEQVFVYSTWQAPATGCQFWGMLDCGARADGRVQLTPFGRAWRDGIQEAGLGLATN